jgi:F-type H+-transporting ATPase subunit a
MIQDIFAHYLNLLLARPSTWLLDLVGLPPLDPKHPISGVFALEILAFLVLLIFFIIVRSTLQVEKPGAAQQLAEMVEELVTSQIEPIIGEKYSVYLSFLTALILFVLINNLLGLVPDLETPTSSPVVPLGLAIVTFVYYHLQGLRWNKISYGKQFLGPLWWMAPLMLLIEVISHLARILSLTVRLFANMFASDLLILISFSLIPFVFPVVFIGFHLFVSLIQAYVFMMLAAIYIGQAVAHEH